MTLFPKKAGIANLMFRTYILIWVPSVIIFLITQSTMEPQIVRILDENKLHTLQTTGQTNQSESLQVKHKTVRAFRRSVSDSIPVHPMIDFARDLVFIWVSTWIGTLLLRILVVYFLLQRIRVPLVQMRDVVTRMASGDLQQPINIEGSELVNNVSNRLEQMRYRLSEGSKNQSQFLRHISHEIKTPLASIKEGARLLSDELLGPISEEQREITDILNKSTLELQASIENLLNYNSAVSMEKVKQRQNVNISTLIELATNRQTLALKTKSIRLSVQSEAIMGFVDPAQITTVFENLLSNAIKFSPNEGLITIKLFRLEKIIQFTIQDDGPGLDENQKDAIFSAFFVGKQTSHGPLRGTGLGLSIVKQYVELHSGKITILELAESKQPGACFQVSFEG